MSTFTVPVVRVRAIEPIPNADAIELVVVGEYRSVVPKGSYRAGDQAVYLPEAAILPEALIAELGLTGRLAGSEKNRVKAIKLRGCLSQGILYQGVPFNATDGDDVAEQLGVTKYEPPVPTHMAGEVANLFGCPLKYDLENYKAFPDVLQDGELVEFTEKAHGTFCGVGMSSDWLFEDMFAGGAGIIYSKGLGARGLVFKDVPANEHNLYVRAVKALDLHRRMGDVFGTGVIVHVLGEVYGPGVQDLGYGRDKPGFAAFDIWLDGRFLHRDEFIAACTMMGIDRVPTLYTGPFSKEELGRYTDGKTVIGDGAHIREGVVVRPLEERRDGSIGRVILKSVSGDYLTRKGNATEFA